MLDEDTKKKILAHYQKGQGSIQDIARVYRVNVDEVLDIIGQQDVKYVEFAGDLIDQNEIGPGAVFNYSQKVKANFTVD